MLLQMFLKLIFYLFYIVQQGNKKNMLNDAKIYHTTEYSSTLKFYGIKPKDH